MNLRIPLLTVTLWLGFSFAHGLNEPLLALLEPEAITVKIIGIVVLEATGEPISGALVELTDHRDNSVRKLTTDRTGEFEFSLEPGAQYTVRSSKKLFNDDYEDVSTLHVDPSEVIRKELRMEPLEIGYEITLEDIYYDFDEQNIREDDAPPALQRLAVTLRNNPEISIELGSHTDSRGSHAYNKRLSEARAKSAVNWLVENGGIDRSRMTYRGYGETQLTNGCADGVECSDVEHQANRRTTFKVTQIHKTPPELLRK